MPTPAVAWRLLGWNNLGMHCMDADYAVFSLLPPYNTIHAQLVDDQGRLVRTPAGITVTYHAIADADGSINRTSAGKTNFWQHVLALFGIVREEDQGLADAAMPGVANTPQPMRFDPAREWFVADGVPITPYDDAGRKNPYPLMRLVARSGTGAVLATTDVVVPVSDEMDCSACHASGSSAAAQPSDGWVNDPDPQRDMRLNILKLHDDRESFRPKYADALATAGYNPAGLFATATTDATAVLCARCHRSEALPDSGLAGLSSLTQAVHRRMAFVLDPVTGGLLDAAENRSACYRCHPGAVTRCLRGVMGSAVAVDGLPAMQCQSCHGSMRDVAATTRTGWLDEPLCQSCHTGTAVDNSGQIRFTSAFDAPGVPREAANQTFASTPDVPEAGRSLFRFSTGHGGLQCAACHGSPHAEFPSAHRNDNIQSVQAQGHVGMLSECGACHTTVPNTTTGGPHGLHPLGAVWVERHPDAAEANPAPCRACHGGDYRGTVLSRAQADRMLATKFGPKHFWRGFQVGCFTCHRGPTSDDANPNRAAMVADVDTTTMAETPLEIPLVATDLDGDSLSLRVVAQPAHGRVALSGTVATYFPDPNFTGTDQFTFAAWDGSTDSNLGTVVITVEAAATPTPLPNHCAGDCDQDGAVTVDELVRGVNIALGTAEVAVCGAFDLDGNQTVTVDELVQAVNAALLGCAPPPTSGPPTPTATATPLTPSATPAATPTSAIVSLAEIESTIFAPNCLDQFCHGAADRAGNLVLAPGLSHDELVNVAPANTAARQAGLLRVAPGNSDGSFLLTKLLNPSLPQGSRMPLGRPPLSAAQIQLIRDWIQQGAQP